MTYEERLESMGLTQKFEDKKAEAQANAELAKAKKRDGYALKVDGDYHYDDDCLIGIAFNVKNKDATKSRALDELERRGVDLVALLED